MPTISNLTLAVTGNSWSDITLAVDYTVTFSPVELFLASNGLAFQERIQIVGDDPGDATDVVLHTFQAQSIPAAPGSVKRSRSITVKSGTLNEDPGNVYTQGGSWGGWAPSRPDADELFARVEVAYVGLNPGSVTADSAVSTITVY
jgi:hypothetical protein